MKTMIIKLMDNEEWIMDRSDVLASTKKYGPIHWLRSAFVIYCSLFIIHSLSAQPGTWQSHASYRPGQSVAVVGNKVYVATQAGFFYYDKISHEITTLTKQDGLSDVGISRLLYLADQQRLLITYQNGNLDLLTLSNTGEPGTVKNINTIVTAPDPYRGAGIFHINRIGNNAYLSVNLGVLVLDLLQDEIKDTYSTQRSDGLRIYVYQTVNTADSLYALTDNISQFGLTRQIRAIRLSPGVNIADPANWRQISLPDTSVSVSSLVVSQERLYGSVPGKGIYERRNGTWSLTQPLSNPVIQLLPGTNGFILATDQAISVPGSGTFTGPLLTNPREVLPDGSDVWVADGQNGLLRGNAGAFQSIAPDGPPSDRLFQLYAYPYYLVGLNADPIGLLNSLDQSRLAGQLSVSNGQWQNLSGASVTSQNLNAAVWLPGGQRLYLGSYGSGLLSQEAGQAPISVTLPASISPFISSLATDSNGNLWITTAGSRIQQQATLHVRRPDGTFQSFPAVNQLNVVQVVPDDNGFLWLRLDVGSGLLVFDPQTNRTRFLSSQLGQGGLLTNSVRALVKDRDGLIWVGTDLGPTVFNTPYSIFDGTTNNDAQPPTLNRRRLLANELVTSIAVDGGNRKWIGTRSGLYHVAPDGSQLLDTFTAANTPLPENSIQALAIEQTTGRVFIETATKGLVSYGGPATEPAETLGQLTIFPNPVRPDFTGIVGINGLTANATVKILDAGGQLVYETRSQGGSATWNLTDYRGRWVQTGVYLIVVVTADGAESLAGKLAVVR